MKKQRANADLSLIRNAGAVRQYYQIASAHSDILCVKSNQDLIFAYFCLQTNIVRIIIGEKPV
jgi:hypothetical protein